MLVLTLAANIYITNESRGIPALIMKIKTPHLTSKGLFLLVKKKKVNRIVLKKVQGGTNRDKRKRREEKKKKNKGQNNHPSAI